MDTGTIVGLLLGLIAGGAIAAIILWFVLKPRTEAEYERVRKETSETRQTAEREAKSIIAAAQSEAKATRLEADKVTEQRYKDLARAEERIDNRQTSLDQQLQKLESREQVLSKRQSSLDKKKNSLEKLEEERLVELQRIAGMTTEEARQQLLDVVGRDV